MRDEPQSGVITGAVAGATAGAGAPYGALVWIAAVEIGLPLTGLAKGPWAYRRERHAASLATHLVIGLTLESTRRCLVRAMR